MTLRTWLTFIGVALVVLAAAGTLALWWMARTFGQAIEADAAIVRARPAAGSLRTDLPPLLKAYVERSQVREMDRARWVRIEQQGEMRLAIDGAWLPLTAVQHNAVAHPAFVWRAQVRMAPGMPAIVLDGLVKNQGILEARLFGAIPVAKSEGPETLKGELQRYLAEIPWNPAAISANRAIAWQAVDAHRVAAVVTLGNVSARVELRFDDAGDIVGASATDRPMGTGAASVPTPWGGAFSDYRVVNGLRIPTHAVVWWDLPTGRFEYWRGDITAVRWE